jgi:hypothetical protein
MRGVVMAKSKKKNYLQFKQDFTIGDLQRLVAERDDALAQYYVGHERFLARAQNRNDPASVFIGPKGIGKSAILQMIRLTEDAHGNSERVIEVAPDDLAFNALVNIKARTPLLSAPGENHWLFKSLWDYVLIVAIVEKEEHDRGRLTKLIQSLLGGRGGKEQSQLLRITLGDDGVQKRSMTDKMLALIEAIQLQGAYGELSGAAEIKLREANPTSEDLRLLQLINNVAKELPNQLSHDYYILIDDLDLHWQGTPLQNAFLGTLFYSMRKLSFSSRLKFVVSLRNNIFREIDLEERDKFADLVCEVSWQKSAIREMIEKRLEFTLNVKANEVWDGLFPDGAFSLLWQSTNGMPREMIRLAVNCVATAQENGHSTISSEDISTATRHFSNERLVDLASDYRYHFPHLQFVCRKFAGGRPEFDIEYLREVAFHVASNRPAGEEIQVGWAERGIDDPLGFARTLLESGFLLLKSGRDAKPRDPSPDDITQIDERNWFAIHPMYSKGLEVHGSHQ